MGGATAVLEDRPPDSKPGNRPLSDVFDALAHPVRRQILDAVRQGEASVSELAEPVSVSRSAVSQHLRILLDHELVSERRKGRQRVYRLRPAALREAETWLRKFEVFWEDKMGKLSDHLDANS